MVERFRERSCKKFHQRRHRRIGCSVICGACGRIWVIQDIRSIPAPTRYRPSLWFSGDMIAHVSSERMEWFLESRAGN
jgi:hypothetical protein